MCEARRSIEGKVAKRSRMTSVLGAGGPGGPSGDDGAPPAQPARTNASTAEPEREYIRENYRAAPGGPADSHQGTPRRPENFQK
jgi:hypothetical protein